jgi:hypothetical protein
MVVTDGSATAVRAASRGGESDPRGVTSNTIASRSFLLVAVHVAGSSSTETDRQAADSNKSHRLAIASELRAVEVLERNQLIPFSRDLFLISI